MRKTWLIPVKCVAIGMALTLSATACKGVKAPGWLNFWSADDKQALPYEEGVLPPPPPLGEDLSGMTSILGPDFATIPPIESMPLIAEGQQPLAPPSRTQTASPASGLETVHFEFDSSRLSDATRARLDLNAEWLRQQPGLQVQIEGHCDERGTREYNFALGERRAIAVREYLASKGVDPNRLLVISYGEDRPVALGSSEEAFSRNRRAQFMVLR